MFGPGNSSELDISTHHISLPSPAPTYQSHESLVSDSFKVDETPPLSPPEQDKKPQIDREYSSASSCSEHLTINIAEPTERGFRWRVRGRLQGGFRGRLRVGLRGRLRERLREGLRYNGELKGLWQRNRMWITVTCGLLVICVFLTIVIPALKSYQHSFDFTPPFASNFTTYPAGDIIYPAPAPEHFLPELYRANWSSPNPELPQLQYDALEPIDPQSGKGRGWTIVFIHGLGAQNASHAYQWRDVLLSTLRRPPGYQRIGNLTGLRFIFPKAPVIPITVYSNQPRNGERAGWFDIKDWRDLNYLEDEERLRQSCIRISTIIIEQIKDSKMQINKTIIAGFSQGAVMALLLSLTLSEPPSATLLLSAYLPLPFRLPLLLSPRQDAYRSTSLYWMHGTDDNVLTYNAAKSGFRLLQSVSNGVFRRAKFKTFPAMQHGFSSDEMTVATNWIEGIVFRNSQGAYDDLLDNLIQPENRIDDVQQEARPNSVLTDTSHQSFFNEKFSSRNDEPRTTHVSRAERRKLRDFDRLPPEIGALEVDGNRFEPANFHSSLSGGSSKASPEGLGGEE